MAYVPWGEERVVNYQSWPDAAAVFTERLKAGRWFGFAEVDIEIPQRLWMTWEEMPPFFFVKQIPAEVVPQYM